MASEDSAASGEVVKKYRIHPTDTGSPEVQVAVITKRLETMSGHFEKHPNDVHSQQGMFHMISQRKSLLAYLKRKDSERYKNLITALGLRK